MRLVQGPKSKVQSPRSEVRGKWSVVSGLSSAFTLIEVVISGSLMALILASGYVCFNAAVASQKVIEPRADLLQNARVAMTLMSADLRSACSLSKDFDLLGMHRMLGT